MSLRQFIGKVLGNANDRELRSMEPFVDAANALEKEYEALTNEQLRQKTDEFRRRLVSGETLDDVLAGFTAFKAAVSRNPKRFSETKPIHPGGESWQLKF